MDQIKTYHHLLARELSIGGLTIGGHQPIAVQSMTNTSTLDTEATVNQVVRLYHAGCDLVRITAPSVKEAENLANIRDRLQSRNINIPLIADIHFTPKAAEIAAKLVDKIRINPGNYVDRNRGKTDWSKQEIDDARKRIENRLIPLLDICKEHNTVIRIGTNHGSLSERILSMYGNTPQGMVESAMEFVRICHDNNFYDLVLSMKASNPRDMIAANLLLVERMLKEGFDYPLHLGVTEAGNGEEARIKSAVGIGHLLARGIGSTVRVSLAEDPVAEVPVGRKLVDFYGRNPTMISELIKDVEWLIPDEELNWKSITGTKYPVLSASLGANADIVCKIEEENKFLTKPGNNFIAHSFSGNRRPAPKSNIIIKKSYPGLDEEDLLIKASTEFSILHINHKDYAVWIENKSKTTSKQLVRISQNILQALGLRFTKAEFVACPSCGRTKFNLFESFNKVKEKTAHLKGLQIAVMGCIVNGPGEMGDADYGYVGAGPGKVTLYRNGEAVLKNIPEENAANDLISLIKEHGDWRDSK